MLKDVTTLTIASARQGLLDKKYTAVELTESILLRAREINADVNAYAEVFDSALLEAEHADTMIKEGKSAPLIGIPIAIKDNMLMKGKISAGGSKILQNHKAVYDATVIKKLKSAGAIIIGRTNMDEFAMGSSSETCVYGPVKNPLDLSRVPGGSSGGSAAAVASHTALGSLGSDTGGSIRQPAALCGVVGLKPTYGAVSRYGLMSMASSFDQIGPFAKTVGDAEVLYHAIEGYDPLDSTSVPNDHALKEQRAKKEKLTIAVPKSFISAEGIDEDVRVRFEETIAGLKKDGHTIIEVDLHDLHHALAVYYVIMPAEVSSNLARYDGIRYGFSKEAERLMEVYTSSRGEGFGKEVRRRILLGTYVLSAGYYDAYYNKAVSVRRMIQGQLREVFTKADVIATPTTTSPAFKLGEKTSDPLKMYLEDIFTVPANIAGIPALSVPTGTLAREGKDLPVGIQFMASEFQEQYLFTAGHAVESLWRKK